MFKIKNGVLEKYIKEDGVTNVVIPNSVTTIGEDAFAYCCGLTTTKANYKAFTIKDGELVCRDYVFKEGEWSEPLDNIEPFRRGYHYCENLFENFNYYCGEIDKDIAIYECEVGDEVVRTDTSKCCTDKIKPVKRLYREDVIRVLNGGIRKN